MEVKNDDPNPNPKPLGFREKEMKTCRGFSYFSSARYAESKNPICLGFSDSTKISVHKEPVLSQPAKLTKSEFSEDIPISLGISDSTKISVHEEPVLSQPAKLIESEFSEDIPISLGISDSTKISVHEVPSQPVKLTKSEFSKDILMLTSFKYACLGYARYGGPPDDSGRVNLSLGCSFLSIFLEQRPHPET